MRREPRRGEKPVGPSVTREELPRWTEEKESVVVIDIGECDVRVGTAERRGEVSRQSTASNDR